MKHNGSNLQGAKHEWHAEACNEQKARPVVISRHDGGRATPDMQQNLPHAEPVMMQLDRVLLASWEKEPSP